MSLILLFLAGSFGIVLWRRAGGVIAEMSPTSKQPLAIGVFASVLLVRLTLRAIIGEFVGKSVWWCWVEGIIAIFYGGTVDY